MTSPRGPEQRPGRASAVAVSDGGDGGRPRLVAKGQGALAEQILAIAFANDVKVREDADLVELLEAVDVDCEIPLAALAAVAEILTYVYRANGGARARSTRAHPRRSQDDPRRGPARAGARRDPAGRRPQRAA